MYKYLEDKIYKVNFKFFEKLSINGMIKIGRSSFIFYIYNHINIRNKNFKDFKIITSSPKIILK